MCNRKPRVVIVGGGPAGLHALKALRGVDADVLILDQNEVSVYYPLLPQVATGVLNPEDISFSLEKIVSRQNNASFQKARVQGVDRDKKIVITQTGEEIPFDYLVMSNGMISGLNASPHASLDMPLSLKSLDDANKIYHSLITSLNQARQTSDAEERRKLLNFAIVGGSFVGVELAGWISQLVKDHYPDLKDDFRLKILHRGDRLVEAFSKSNSERVHQILVENGVEIVFNSEAQSVRSDHYVVNGQTHHVNQVFWAAGGAVSPCTQGLSEDTDEKGRIKVRSDLSIDESVYAAGDIAKYSVEGDSTNYLPVFPLARDMGRYVGKQIKSRIQGKPNNDAFRYSDPGQVLSLTKGQAVAEFRNQTQIMNTLVGGNGLRAHLAWSVININGIMPLENKMRILCSWLLGGKLRKLDLSIGQVQQDSRQEFSFA